MDRTLYFHYNGLSQNVNLMLCFNPPTKNALGKDQNVVAWKIIAARKGVQNGTAVVTYSARNGFGENEMDNGNLVLGSVVTEMKEGQSVLLKTDDSNFPVWDTPQNDPSVGKLIRATNATTMARTMSVGTVKGNGTTFEYQPTFLWKVVGPNLAVEAQFTPILSCFLNLGYQENEFIRADIMSQSIKKIDLSGLSGTTHFDLIETPQHGYVIEQRGAESAMMMMSNISSLESYDEGKVEQNGVEQNGVVQTAVAGVPPTINLMYNFKVKWSQHISRRFVRSKFDELAKAFQEAEVTYSYVAHDDEDFRTVTASKPGLTCAVLKDVVSDLIQMKLTSDFRVLNETFSNVSSDAGLVGIDVREYIAPESLAYYYVQ